ncbi:hypothetical protein ABT173_29120 [Streptomyces sp. NPDC001795]|uniref:hypothetical protein n=1 Tax=unclassified Streptomyces TaxID=2593676 RepID=UPI00332CD911
MRRTTLHRTTVVAVAAAALLLAGCGTQSDGKSAGSSAVSPSAPPSQSVSPSGTPSAPASASPSVPPSGAPSATTPATGCTAEAQLTAADTGRTVCLTTGGQIRLTLDGTKDRPWTTVSATGNALKATNAGIVIQPGDAVAAYDAVAPGTARLTATRPLCAKRPGQKSCLGIQQWTVTVTVTKP